jgi:hypothetical protein
MEKALKTRIRRHLVVFVVALALSGLTAIPLESESAWAVQVLDWIGVNNAFSGWIHHIHNGIKETAQRYPFIGYGTDWLAFGHVVIAIFFIGPIIDPVRNRWVIEAGIIACALVFPLAFIMGNIRGIPFYWQCVDCSFGLGGGIILLSVARKIRALEKAVIKRTGYKYY